MPVNLTIPRICAACGSEFLTSRSRLNAGSGILCSRECRGAHLRRKVDLVCQQCGSTYQRTPSLAINAKFCSASCKNASMTGTRPIMERCWSHITRGDPNACWLWGAGIDAAGYPQIAGEIQGITKKPHRLVLEEQLGYTLRSDEVVMHSCDIPRCCNPSHLSVGTGSENNKQMSERGRVRNLVLNSGIVPIIRNRIKNGEDHRLLAQEYGMSISGMRKLKDGNTWKNIK